MRERERSCARGDGVPESGGADRHADRELLLAAALVDLAGTERTPGPLTQEEYTGQRLGALARYARNWLAAGGVCAEAAALLWNAPGGARRAVGHSGRWAGALQRLEFDRGEGPTVEALRTGWPPRGALLNGGGPSPWPAFGATARAIGVRRVTTLPLRHQDRSFGVLVLYQYEETAVPRHTLAVVQGLADACLTGLAARGDARRVGQLLHALDSRVVIEQAKGIVAERRRCTLDEAFSLLRGHARSSRRSLRGTAGAVVDGALTEPPFHRGGPAS